MRKTESLTKTVCLQFCSYYKPGKNEELSCGGYERINRLVTDGGLIDVRVTGSACDAGEREQIVAAVCPACGFREDGCDFMLDRDAPPCGGFRMLSQLIADGVLRIGEL